MIYAIQCGENGPIKFGMAKDPFARFSTLQVSSPYELVLLACEETDNDAEAEQLIHAKCNAYWIRGEWFRPDGVVLEVVANMGAGLAQCAILIEKAKKYLEIHRKQQELHATRTVYRLMKRLVEIQEQEKNGQPVLA